MIFSCNILVVNDFNEHFCWETKKIIRNHFESSTLWFWGFWHSLAPHLGGKYIIPGDPPNRSPSQGSHADTESARSTAFLPIVDHSKGPDPSGYHAWLWNLWSLDGGTSLISQAKHAVESNKFNPLLLNSHQGPIFKILDHRKSLTIGWGRWAKGSWVIFGVGFPNPKADFGVEKVFGFITLFFAREFERWQKVDHLERIGSWNAIEGQIPRHGLGVCSFILQDSSRFFEVYDCSKTWEPKKNKLFQMNHISPKFCTQKKHVRFCWRLAVVLVAFVFTTLFKRLWELHVQSRVAGKAAQ